MSGPQRTGRNGTGLDGVDLAGVWVNVAAEVWRRHPGRLERTAGRLLRSPGLARALCTTPSLLLPWLIAAAVVFGVGALAGLGVGQPVIWLVAPAIAAVGIAYAYGPDIDPAWELSCSMAVSDRMVLLTRTVVVFAVNAALGLAASAVPAGTASQDAAAITFAWLIPMTAICALTLAVAVAARSANVGAAAGVGAWIITVLGQKSAGGQLTAVITNTDLYFVYLAVAACCAVVVLYMTRLQRGVQ